MSVVITERQIGRRMNAVSSERAYTIQHAADEGVARTQLLAFIPTTLNGMFLDYNETEVEEIAEDLFYGTVKYKALQQLPASFHISFDISGQNTHLTQSKATVAKYPTAARDFKGAINVDADGNIAGCDVLVPYMTFQINYTWDAGDVDDTYIQTLTNIVGTTNADMFHNFQIGTLLLTKVSGQQRDDLAWDMSYGFAVSKNATGLTVGDITGIAKKGWEFMWVYYMDKTDTTFDGTKYVRKIPASVHIEKVYDSSTYADLGI